VRVSVSHLIEAFRRLPNPDTCRQDRHDMYIAPPPPPYKSATPDVTPAEEQVRRLTFYRERSAEAPRRYTWVIDL
jgi:hypothetical protein